MGIEDAFLQEILEHPDDDAPRLIYADWLDERGDPRGEFIRVQCALAQLSAEDPRRWPLEQREQELLREHGVKWRPKDIGSAECVFRRGFVEETTLILQDFLRVAGRLLAQAPIRHVCLRERSNSAQIARVFESAGFQDAARSPHLARLRGLSLTFQFPLLPQEVRTLTESPYLDQVADLRLSLWNVEEEALSEWTGAIFRPALRSLDLSGSRELPSSFLRALAQSPQLMGLQRLNLADNGLRLDDVRVIADSSSLANLRELNLNGCGLTHQGAAVLGEGRLLRQLETLHLNVNLLGDAGALAIRDWPASPKLTRLSLDHNHIRAAGIQALAEAPALRELIAVDLFGNIACDEGTVALASSDWKQLQAINLRFNGVGDYGAQAIAESQTLSHLTWLNLTANRVTSAGARALVESPGLSSLARLDLPRNDIDAAQQQRLRERFGMFVTF